MTAEHSASSRIAALLAIDPVGLGGVWVRARHGPRRDRLIRHLSALPGSHVRIMPETGDRELFGGMDLSESLFSGNVVMSEGLIARSDVLWLCRGECLLPGMAARLSAALDSGDAGAVVLKDEAAEADETPPPSICDRLAFFLSDSHDDDDGREPGLSAADLHAARQRLVSVELSDAHISAAARTAVTVHCESARAAVFVVRAARAIAALDGKHQVDDAQMAEAARLVLTHRAIRIPEDVRQDSQPETGSEPTPETEAEAQSLEDSLRDIVLDAARTNLPDDLLAAVIGRNAKSSGSGRGSERTSSMRGRPLPSRAGKPDGRNRLDVLATLRAAAPWQKLRNRPDHRLAIRTSDLRVRRYQERSERMLIFLVDASGSAAMARLAEAKGAAETLLAEAYRSRDHVSLISFRGHGAECVLEPTKSLVRAKRLLGGLPGGGATPLAAALREGARQAALARRKGLAPFVILMTDGRANRALDGSTNRVTAREDAARMARHMVAIGVSALVVDSGLRPSAELDDIANALAARTIRLPPGTGGAVSKELMSVLDF